ncbi:PrsW family intramembrane metalloprotease [Actinomyces vulturis]|uniref:PrsW family intramembrane metalloprotease n=1 Tax=Actinomyces vulturis TaxID=1857645 RepID=UPI000B116CA4|nr:PrsW family intramembrane metalloprotease [Actinomyces vulturis]
MSTIPPSYPPSHTRQSSPQALPGMDSAWQARPGYQSAPAATPITYAQTPFWAQPQAPQRHERGDILRYIIGAFGILGLLGLLWLISSQAGSAGSTILATVLALVPLAIVLATVRWIDRWEPEPITVLIVAFLWGAGVATVISLIVNTSSALVVAQLTGDTTAAETFSSVVAAPLIEEGTKGLGVLIIFLIWRRYVDGPVDGIVYAAVVAAGFAFAENILYFVQYQDELVATFIARGIASPFAHIIFTSVTGLAIGLSARMRSRVAWLWMWPLGYIGAVTLHAIWNGIVAANPVVMYLVLEVPLFFLCVGIVLWLRWKEKNLIRQRLGEYARAGWFVPSEVTMLTTGSGRRSARTWAKSRGPEARSAMKQFQNTALRLAHMRQQAIDGHAGIDYPVQESRMLHSITQLRMTFLR